MARRARRGATCASRRVLASSFGPCQAARVLACLPTLRTLHAAGSSSQHSPWTGFAFFAAKLSRALALHESIGRVDRLALVNPLNALLSPSAALPVCRHGA